MIAAGTLSIESYVGDDTASNFTFSFPTFESSNIKVTVTKIIGQVKTILVLTIDYTINGIGKRSGGSIDLVDAGQDWLTLGKLKTGFTLDIEYNVVAKQLANFNDLGPHGPAAFEKALDRLTMDFISNIRTAKEVADFLADAYNPSAIQTIAAGGIITVKQTDRQHRRIKSDGGSKALSTTPFGTDDNLLKDGMFIVVEGTDDADFITMSENNIDYGFQGNGGLQLKKGTVFTFTYNGTVKRFYLAANGAW